MSEIKYVDYSALGYYDGKIKAYIGTKDAEILARAGVTIEALETPDTGDAATYVVYQNYAETGNPDTKTKIEVNRIHIPLDVAVESGSLVTTAATTTEDAKAEIVLVLANTTDASTTSGKKEVRVDISDIAGDITEVIARIEKLEALHETIGEGDDERFQTVSEQIEAEAKDATYKAESAEGAGDGETIGEALERFEDDLTYKGTVAELPADPAKGDLYNVVPAEGAAADAPKGWKFYDGAAWQSLDDPTLTARVQALETQVGKDKDINAYQSKSDLADIMNVLTADVDTTGSVLNEIKSQAGSADSNVTKIDKYEEIANPGTFITIAEYESLTDEQKELYRAVNKTLTINEAIKDAKDAATEGSVVTVEKQNEAEESYAATYVVKQNGEQVGVKINIPKDFLVKSAELKTVETADVPYTGAKIGDKYIDFVVNAKDVSETEEHIYLPVNDLVDVYTGKEVENGISIAVDENNEISAVVSGKAIARENIDDDFEADLAAIEAAIGTTDDDELYAVTDRIKAEAKDGIYKTTEVTTPTLCGQLYNDFEAIFVEGRTTDGEGIAVGDKCYQSDGTYLGTLVLDAENDKLYPSEKEASKDFYSYDTTKTIHAVENQTINVKSNETKTIAEAIAALEEASSDTNGAFVFKGSVANKAALPTTAKKGDAYLVTDINTLFIKDETEFKQLAANGTFSVGNDTLAHDVDVKAYIDSRIFIGTQSEVDTKKAAGEIDDTTFIVVTDADSQELVAVTEAEVDALFA